MCAYHLRYRLGDSRDQPWVFQDADRWIAGSVDFLKLVMSIEFNLPSETFQLTDKASFDEVNRTLVDARLGLSKRRPERLETFLIVWQHIYLT